MVYLKISPFNGLSSGEERKTNRSTFTYNNVYIKASFILSRAAVVRFDVNYGLVHLEVTTIINSKLTISKHLIFNSVVMVKFWVFE